MSKQHEKSMIDFQRLLSTKDFKTEKELRDFMNSLVGTELPSFPEETLTNEEKAINLVLSAYDFEPRIGFEKVMEALELDSDCIEAYEFLGNINDFPPISDAFYEKGISIGRKKFGAKYFKENKGHFWLLHETRPFMRCMHLHANCLYELNKIQESIEVFEEMIELNPNDNQGIRDQLLLYLIEVEDKIKFAKYEKQYKSDFMTFSLFNRALFAFINEGETKNSETLLRKAIKQNKYVAKKLISRRDSIFDSDGYTTGSEEEADYYVSHSKRIWESKPGAKDWLKRISKDKK
jgi:tetratricopeptide (TPR) repeat protein